MSENKTLFADSLSADAAEALNLRVVLSASFYELFSILGEINQA
jgi:hypothetical protein